MSGLNFNLFGGMNRDFKGTNGSKSLFMNFENGVLYYGNGDGKMTQVKSSSVNGSAKSDAEFLTTPVENNYDTVAEMYSDGANQTVGFFQYIESADDYYEFLKDSGDASGYRLLTPEETNIVRGRTLPPVHRTYATLAQLYSGQKRQRKKWFQYVSGEGKFYYYLGTRNGDASDYIELGGSGSGGPGGPADTFQSQYAAGATSIDSTDGRSEFSIALEPGQDGFVFGINNKLDQYPDDFTDKDTFIVKNIVDETNPKTEVIGGSSNGDFKFVDEFFAPEGASMGVREIYGVSRGLFGSFAARRTSGSLIIADGLNTHPDNNYSGGTPYSANVGLQPGTGSGVIFGDALALSSSELNASWISSTINQPLLIKQFGQATAHSIPVAFTDGTTTVFADQNGIVNLSTLTI